MVHNDAMPAIDVDPELSEARAGGRLLTCAPALQGPLARRFFLL